MVYLSWSPIDPKILEIRDESIVLQEVEVRFLLRKFPSSFPSLELALKWLEEVEMKLAKARAYRLLAIRSYPSNALLQNLIKKGFSDRISQSVIDAFKELGYLQDEDFWSHVIEKEFKRGYGPRYLQWKKRAPEERVRAMISESMQREKIRELLKKLPSSKKAASILVRRGFDLDCIAKELDLFS